MYMDVTLLPAQGLPWTEDKATSKVRPVGRRAVDLKELCVLTDVMRELFAADHKAYQPEARHLHHLQSLELQLLVGKCRAAEIQGRISYSTGGEARRSSIC